MGFFKDFKEDLSETASELNDAAKKNAQTEDKRDDVIVNTLDDPELAQMAADFAKEAQTVEEPVPVLDEPQAAMDAAEPFMTAAEDEETIADETAVITAGLSVTGDLSSIGSIDVFGSVTGNVACRGKLTVSGTISGNSKANEIFANSAQVDGNMEAKGSVKIGQGTVIVGNISATSAVIAGAVKGDIDVHGPVIIDSTAIIVGDIKSKTVQINNGATIDGRCSQCYADVNTASIFDIKLKRAK